MPGCSALPDSHNFSTYVAPAWVDEPNPKSYCDIPSRGFTCTLCLSFGSTEFGDMAIPDLAPSIVQNASHGPMDVTEETQVPGRMKNHKSKHCADPVAAIKRRDNKYGDNDAWLDVFAKVYLFLEEVRLKRMDVSDESLEFLAKSFHGFKVGEDEFGYMVADILKESNVNSDGNNSDRQKELASYALQRHFQVCRDVCQIST
ncbi:hypothetical protein FXO38_28480 [Capsicum annuum]|nr:hypothetical protein FXO38_28480 [Capsicum annuum]